MGTISRTDLDLLLFTDSVDEAMAHIEKHAVEQFGLVRHKLPRVDADLRRDRGLRTED